MFQAEDRWSTAANVTERSSRVKAEKCPLNLAIEKSPALSRAISVERCEWKPDGRGSKARGSRRVYGPCFLEV